MFESSIERTIVGTAIALWFAHGWYLNSRLRAVHAKLDFLVESFDGLREYLYEVDSQFDDERRTRDAVLNDEHAFAGMDDMQLLREKEEAGRRTLRTPFVRR